MAASCVSRGSAALHRLLSVLRPYGALPDGNMFDFEDIGLFFLRAQKYRKKLVFGEENHFFAERLAGWEKGCNYILADMFLQNTTIPPLPRWVYGTGT